MKRFLILLLVLATPVIASEPIVLETDGLPNGVHYLKITKSGDNVSVVPLDKVIRLGNNPNPPPPPPPSSLSSKVHNLTLEAFKKGGTITAASGLAEVYSSVAAAKLTESQVFGADGALKKGTDVVFNVTKDADAWNDWRIQVGVLLKERAPPGSSPEVIASALKEVEQGLKLAFNTRQEELFEAAKTGEGILDTLNIAQLVEIIRLIIELIKTFKT